MAEKKALLAEERGKQCKDTWKLIEEALLEEYGCLLPPGEAAVFVVLAWTKEKFLGELKRQGRIVSWSVDKEFKDGNKRRYEVTVDTDAL